MDKIVVSSRIADKYFGDTSPLGEVITISNKVYEIEGVLKPAGRSSHLNIDFLGVNDYADPKGDLWLTKYFLSANENEYDMERQVNQLFNGEVDKAYKFSIQRLIDIHLHTNPELNDFSVNGNIDFLYVLGSVALLILITVSFNHTNLTWLST